MRNRHQTVSFASLSSSYSSREYVLMYIIYVIQNEASSVELPAGR